MKPSFSLTAKQARILTFIQNKTSDKGKPPTLREIGSQFGFNSTGTTRGHLKSLAKKGYIRLTPRKSRSIELVKPVIFRIPILGKIMAGMPQLAFEETEGFLQLDEFLPNPDRDIFALNIKGDSMIEKGIHEGDIAIIRRQRIAIDADIVAALIENEATIKIFKKQKTLIYLAPANKNYKEIHSPFEILGKVIAVIKRF
ncbi:MAG: repressor LexA [Candidatus Omnitrophica bacterium CG1_02_44_16]|nr:MAG: repressor LexA [Candidatus Omnitrophica bacterium CG1_02_44_16]PIY83311.1 MAG: repressor LexA [Candidatus Omnitrophica bacterium CG_4_10_14_0_8_um_filter_44_12]PIZ84538.1 MAG: repressor LexA [Candidatus Omnitrophica bacterium CG_4_10_14_0_2_um_filter_44_9]